MTFPIEKLYRELAMQVVGKKLNHLPFGPAFVHVKTKDGEIVDMRVTPPMLILPFLVREGGQDQLKSLIEGILAQVPDTNCIMLAHEAHAKLVAEKDFWPDTSEAMKSKGLQYDPTAKNVVVFKIYHRDSQLFGLLPITADRIIEYAEPLNCSQVIHVHPDADRNIH